MGKSTSIWTTLGFLCFLTWMLAVQLAENLMELFFHVVRKVVRKELRSEQFGSHLNGKNNKTWCTQFQEISEVPMGSYGILWDPMATVSWTATGEELQGHSEFLTHRMGGMGIWKPSDFNLQNRKSFSLIASTPTMQGATSASEATIDPNDPRHSKTMLVYKPNGTEDKGQTCTSQITCPFIVGWSCTWNSNSLTPNVRFHFHRQFQFHVGYAAHCCPTFESLAVGPNTGAAWRLFLVFS